MRNVNQEIRGHGNMSQYGYLMHHGIKGQKWGVRRYQNEDGSLTEAGKKHYSYEGAKKAKTLSRLGMGAGLTAGGLSIAALMKQAYDDSKTPQLMKKTKEYKKDAALQTGATGIMGLFGITNGLLLQSNYDRQLNDIIKNASSEEFNKIKKDKRFANNPTVQNRVHFDNFEKLNKITSNMSNHQKAELYVKQEFKNHYKGKTPDPDDEGAWYNSHLAGDWYGIKDNDLEKMCWKYQKQYSKY